MSSLRIGAAAAFMCLYSLVAHATPVLYSFSGTFSGTLGSSSFSNIQGVISLAGDTNTVTQFASGNYFFNTTGVKTVTLLGIGTATFVNSTFGVISQYDNAHQLDAAGFYDSATFFGVVATGPAFTGYRLTAPFGPQSGDFGQNYGSELTDRGNFTLSAGSGVTFSAASSITPEPSSLGLLGTGIFGMLIAARRHRSTFAH